MSRDERKPPQIYDAPQLDTEEAETAVFASVEQRPNNSGDETRSSDYRRVFDALGGVEGGGDDHQRKKLPKLKEAAKKVMLMKASDRTFQQRTMHRKNPSQAQNILESIQRPDEYDSLLKEKSGYEHDDKLYQLVHDDSNEEEEAVSEVDEQELPLLEPSSARYGSLAVRLQTPTRRRRSFYNKLKRHWDRCHPVFVWQLFVNTFLMSYLLTFAFPCFFIAFILYYELGNPELDFLPGKARLSWWFNFLGRQIVTLELARISQWLLFDLIVLGSRYSVKLFGPFITLFVIHAKGWPFLLVAWSLWDLVLLHGDNAFQTHWFYWTEWKIYTEANSGSYILSSGIYLRLLLSGLLAGFATAVKRAVLAVRFGRRQFSEFKPRLEKILTEVVILNEVAALAKQAEELDDGRNAIDVKQAKDKGLVDVKWGSVKFQGEGSSPYEDSDEEEDSEAKTGLKSQTSSRSTLEKTRSGSIRIKNLLDRWEEPVNKLDKGSDASIEDVLKFKRALSYMDNTEPFGEDFGPASDRNECIESSHALYYKLLKLSGKDTLPFEVLELLSTDDEGMQDINKRRAIRKLFRPDAGEYITLLAFVQTCDSVYKRLRYFRASVGNASVIDKVLEDIANGVFFFILILLLLSLMQYNPWTLLVSITSLLVSVSFAMGQTVSKYVEGVGMILRKPFDLGDRIFISGAESIFGGDVSGSTWFVEDINLTTTTLRFARTNEMCSMPNWAISGSRIINCNRSPNAVVVLEMQTHISIFEKDKLTKFRDTLQKYIADNPRIWDSMAFVRPEVIDNDNEIVSFVMAFRHRNSWQDAARIKINRSDLLRFAHDTANKLEVNFETPAARRLLYYGGVLERGQVQDYKKNLLRPSNIRSRSTGDQSGRNQNYPGDFFPSYHEEDILQGE